MVSSILQIAGSIVLPNAIGIAGSFVTKSQIPTWYKDINKPSWRPPNWVFPIVWPSLYTGMGVASYLVYRDGNGFDGPARLPLTLYAANLVLNGIWTPLFFGLHRVDLALIDMVLLLGCVGSCIGTFAPINKTAAYLMIPYLFWGLYATALTYRIWMDNPSKRNRK